MIAQEGIKLNEENLYLIEALKVESYWNRKTFTLTFQNKDLTLLNQVEKIVRKLNLNIYKRILLKIKLEDNTRKEQVRILNKNKELNFHIEKSPFDENKVKAVTSLPYESKYILTLIYKNHNYPIQINFSKIKAQYKSALTCYLYKDLRFPAKKLLDFLDNYCGDKKNFHVEEYLFHSDLKKVMSAFSALVDCEGTLNWYGFKRQIQIRMRNKNYLKQWSELLKKHRIGSTFREKKDDWELDISGWEDFDKLEKGGFKLFHSEKAKKWEKMMQGFKRNQVSRNTAEKFYLEKLREMKKPMSVKEFALILNKSKRVVNHYLKKLNERKLLKIEKSNERRIYSPN